MKSNRVFGVALFVFFAAFPIDLSAQAYDEYPVERCTGTACNYDYLVANDYVAAQ